MEEILISETGLRILETLELYQFLTADQITRAGGFRNTAVVRRQANDYAARRAPLLHCKDFGALPGRGRLSKVFAMSEHGAEVLAEYRQCDLAEITHLTGKIQFSIDYDHRLSFVETHIAMRAWAEEAGADIEFFTGYFETDGANRTGRDAMKLTKKNRIDLPAGRWLVPDGIFAFELAGRRRLCALEVHRGQDTKTILGQLGQHVDALYSKAIQGKYGHDSGNFVLSVYEHPGTMAAVKKRVAALPRFGPVSKAFHFATLEDVWADVRTAWTLADGSPVSIFAPAPAGGKAQG